MSEWLPFTASQVKKNNRAGLMVVSRFNARSHVGIMTEVTDRFVVLVNGADMETLYFEHLPSSTRFQIIDAAGAPTFGVGDHRLPL